MRNLTAPVVLAGITVATIIMAVAIVAPTVSHSPVERTMAQLDRRPILPPCATEDSTQCYWDAQTMGNGRGRSFIALDDGLTVYVENPLDPQIGTALSCYETATGAVCTEEN